MKKRFYCLLVCALGVSAFADELDELIYKIKGIAPPQETQAPVGNSSQGSAIAASSDPIVVKTQTSDPASVLAPGSEPAPASTAVQTALSVDDAFEATPSIPASVNATRLDNPPQGSAIAVSSDPIVATTQTSDPASVLAPGSVPAPADELDELIYKIKGIPLPPEAQVPVDNSLESSAIAKVADPIVVTTRTSDPASVLTPGLGSASASTAVQTPLSGGNAFEATTPIPASANATPLFFSPGSLLFRRQDGALIVVRREGEKILLPPASRIFRLLDGTLVVSREGEAEAFPPASRAFRLPDETIVVSREGEESMFPPASRVFRLSDETLVVIVPDPSKLAAWRQTLPQSSKSPSAIVASSPAKVSTSRRPVGNAAFRRDPMAFRDFTGRGATDWDDGEASDSKFYTSVRALGASLTADVSDDYSDEVNSFDDFAGVSLAFGRRFNDKWCVEIEGSYAAASDEGNDATTLQGFVNALYSIPIARRTSFFAGGGVGVLHYEADFEYTDSYLEYYTAYTYSWYGGFYPTRYSYRRYYTADGSGEAILAALNATAGLSFSMTPSMSLDMAFRYITTLEGEFKSDEIDDRDIQLEFIGAYAGLRVLF